MGAEHRRALLVPGVIPLPAVKAEPDQWIMEGEKPAELPGGGVADVVHARRPVEPPQRVGRSHGRPIRFVDVDRLCPVRREWASVPRHCPVAIAELVAQRHEAAVEIRRGQPLVRAVQRHPPGPQVADLGLEARAIVATERPAVQADHPNRQVMVAEPPEVVLDPLLDRHEMRLVAASGPDHPVGDDGGRLDVAIGGVMRRPDRSDMGEPRDGGRDQQAGHQAEVDVQYPDRIGEVIRRCRPDQRRRNSGRPGEEVADGDLMDGDPIGRFGNLAVLQQQHRQPRCAGVVTLGRIGFGPVGSGALPRQGRSGQHDVRKRVAEIAARARRGVHGVDLRRLQAEPWAGDAEVLADISVAEAVDLGPGRLGKAMLGGHIPGVVALRVPGRFAEQVDDHHPVIAVEQLRTMARVEADDVVGAHRRGQRTRRCRRVLVRHQQPCPWLSSPGRSNGMSSPNVGPTDRSRGGKPEIAEVVAEPRHSGDVTGECPIADVGPRLAREVDHVAVGEAGNPPRLGIATLDVHPLAESDHQAPDCRDGVADLIERGLKRRAPEGRREAAVNGSGAELVGDISPRRLDAALDRDAQL